MTTQDKRKYSRIEFKVAVDVKTDSLLQKFHARNLSQGGIFLEVPGKAPRLGTKLALKFTVPGLNHPLELMGKVLYVHKYETFDADESEGKNGIGIQFVDLSQKDEKIISEYISGKHVSVG